MNQHAHKCHIWGAQIKPRKTTKGLTSQKGWINLSEQHVSNY